MLEFSVEKNEKDGPIVENIKMRTETGLFLN